MKTLALITLTILFLCLPVFGQTTLSQLSGKVVDANNKPVPNLELTPSNGESQRTKKDGTFTLYFQVGPGKATTIRAGGNWAINEPFGGRFTTQDAKNASSQTIHVLPKGSPQFIDPDHLILVGREVVAQQLKTIRILNNKTRKLTAENESKGSALDEAYNTIDQLQKELAKSQVIREYADQTGYSYETIAAALERWSNTQYKSYPESDQAVQRSLKGDVPGASLLATSVLDKQLQDVSRQGVERERITSVSVKTLHDAFLTLGIAVEAPREDGDWAKVVGLYNKFEKELTSEPDFKEVFHIEWAQLSIQEGIAKSSLAAISLGNERTKLFAEATQHVKEAFTFYRRETDPVDWGVVEFLNASILLQRAQDLRGEEQEHALTEGFTRLETIFKLNAEAAKNNDCSQTCWNAVKLISAMMMTAIGDLCTSSQCIGLSQKGVENLELLLNNFQIDLPQRLSGFRDLILGLSHFALGDRPAGKDRVKHFLAAKAVFERALQGNLSGSNRQLAMWILSYTLLELGQISPGKEGIDYLNSAVELSNRVLTSCDVTAQTHTCASPTTQVPLAILVMTQRGEVKAAHSALLSYIDTIDRQLKSFPPDVKSDNKLTLQIALGKARLQFNEVLPGAEGMAQAWKGLDYLTETLAFLDKDNVEERALTQLQMLGALLILSSQVGVDKVAPRIDDLVSHIESLIKDPAQCKFPTYCISLEISLGGSLQLQGLLLTGPDRTKKLNSALGHFRNALSHLSTSGLTEDWARANGNLGDGLLAIASDLPPDQGRQKALEALQAYEQALTVLTPASMPAWAQVRTQLGSTKFQLALQLGGEEGQRQQRAAIQMLIETANAIDRGSYPLEWAATQASLGRSYATIATQQTTFEKAQVDWLAAIEALEKALSVKYPNAAEGVWAQALSDYGRMLSSFADSQGGAEGLRNHTKAVQALEQALTIPAMKAASYPRAIILLNLAHSLSIIGMADGPGGRDNLTKAAQNFDAAIAIIPKNGDWIRAQIEVGHTRYALANFGGPEQTNNVSAAIYAYEQVLPLLSSPEARQQWAATNGDLGDSLYMSGWLSTGQERTAKWLRAVTAYKQAAEFYKTNSDRQSWAQANSGLGNTLLALGTPRDPEREAHLKAAVDAFQKAISVTKAPGSEQLLLNLKNSLGDTYFQLHQAKEASQTYAEILSVAPNDPHALSGMAGVNHELLFNYLEALRIQEKLSALDPQNLDNQASLAESYFTAGKYAEADAILTKLLDQSQLNGNTLVAMRAIKIANLLAQSNTTQVLAQLDLLVSDIRSQPANFQLEWWFDGTQHFVSQSKEMSKYQKWFGSLLKALGENDRDSIVASLEKIKANYK